MPHCKEVCPGCKGASTEHLTDPEICDLGPMPRIDRSTLDAFTLFRACLGMFVSPGMGGQRTHIDRSALEIEARYRGVPLSEWTLDHIAVCESVIRKQDFDRLEAERAASQTPRQQ